MSSHRTRDHHTRDRENFEIVPAAGGGAGPFAEALARLIERIGRDGARCVIISSTTEPARYAQLIVCDCGIHAEAVSNHFLSDYGLELSDDDELALVELGWHPPRTGLPEWTLRPDDPHDPDEHGNWPPNWWVDFAPVEADGGRLHLCRTAAALLVTTLLGVHGVSEYEPVEVNTFPTYGPCEHCGR